MKNITFSLSAEGVNKCIEELEELQNSLNIKIDTFCKELGKIGVETATNILMSDERATGCTVSIEQAGTHDYVVVAQGEQVAFIEFGVGVVGQSGGYPSDKLLPTWQYDERRSPWAHDTKDPTRWYYYDDSSILRSTRGTTPVGYMNTADERIRQSVANIAKKVFTQ